MTLETEIILDQAAEYYLKILFLSVGKLCPFLKQLVSFFPPLQIEVVNTFKSGTSFQGALRRQSSVTSQNQDVTNISSPSHVSLSNALSSPTSTPDAAAGRECVFLMHLVTEMPTSRAVIHDWVTVSSFLPFKL